MTLLETLLIFYSAIISAVLIYIYYTDNHNLLKIKDFARKRASEGNSSLENVQAVTELLKATSNLSPWYEKGLSAIGIVAFFSMSIATGIQTININSNTAKLEVSKKELQLAEERIDVIDRLTREIASDLTHKRIPSNNLTTLQLKIVEFRISQLEEKSDINNDDFRELFQLLLINQDYKKAINLFHNSIELIDDSRLSDLISLAQYYLLTGVPSQAELLYKSVYNKYNSLPDLWKYKILIIGVAIDRRRLKEHSRQLSVLNKIGINDANSQLLKEIERYENVGIRTHIY